MIKEEALMNMPVVCNCSTDAQIVLIKATGSEASIIIVIDVSFDSKDAKLKALKQLRSWVTNKCRSFQFQFVFSSIAQRSHSSAKRQPPPPPVVVAAAAATASAATQSSFLLQHLMCCVKKSTWYIEQKRALAAQHTVLWVL